jgi:DNA polymerase-3 subunit epsilon
MRILGIDFETTGFDPANDRITEVGWALFDAGQPTPLKTSGEFLYEKSYPKISKEVEAVTGITDQLLEEFGRDPAAYFSELEHFCGLHRVEFVVAHNGRNFDRPFLFAHLDRLGLKAPCLRGMPWVDTRIDLPFAREPDSRKLKYLSSDHGFLNPFSHRALFDVLTMMKVLSHYDFEKVLEYRAQPALIVRAMVPQPWDDGGKGKDAARKVGFSWQEINHKKYDKCWVKMIKKHELEALCKRLPEYEIKTIEEVQNA